MTPTASIHLDTDLGGDPDDVCALALLLTWPGVQVTGITTNLDMDGERAACVRRVLQVAGRDDLDEVVVAGAPATMTDGRRYKSTAEDERYWNPPVMPEPSPQGAAIAAIEALDRAIDRGDTIVTIGALTNLATLELAEPGRLRDAHVVAMGGWVRPLATGLPPWGPERDFNIQCDPRAAEVVIGATGDLTLVTLPATATAHLRRSHLDRVRAIGPLGRLMAAQSEAYAEDSDRAQLAAAYSALPDDLVNFHWDPVTCAVAVGWEGVTVEEVRLLPFMRAGVLHLRETREGLPVRIVIEVDGVAFGETWLATLERGR